MESIFTNPNLGMSFLYQAFESSSDDYLYIGDVSSGDFLISDTMKNDFGISTTHLSDFSETWLSLLHPHDTHRVRREIENWLNVTGCVPA